MSRYVDLDRVLRIVKAEWMRVRDDTVPGDIALQMVEQEIRALPTVDVDALREALEGLVYEITHLSAREVETLPRGLRAEVYRCAVDASKVDDARAALVRLREQEPAPKCDGPALYTTCDGRSVCTYHANLWDHASARHDSWAIVRPDPERKCDGGAS